MNRLVVVFAVALFFAGCKKDLTSENEEAFVSFINAVPSVPLSIYVDTVFAFRIPPGTFTRNLPVTVGQHVVSIRDSGRIKTLLTILSQEFTRNTSSTIVVYDTLNPVDSTVKAIRLSDDLNLAPNGFVKIRFLHAAPRTNPVDVTFLRTSVSPPDSITFSSRTYIGSALNVQALSAFNDLPIGNYTLKIKSAGTQDTILNTIKLSVSNLAGSAGISGISTFYLTGGAQNRPLQVGLFRHYP